MTLRAAIIIISSTAARNPSQDSSETVLREVFHKQGVGAWEVVHVGIVKDDIQDIQQTIKSLSDVQSSPNLIVTTGGTGFSLDDVTPEAVGPLLDKHAPGIVHGVLAAGYLITPFALVSRPTAGVRNRTVIITLPGSTKGAKESLESIIKLLPHVCQQASGADSRILHVGGVESLEREADFTIPKPHQHS
ncbi:gephyrin, partial [Blumeria graminis f. sp. tritici 96224]